MCVCVCVCVCTTEGNTDACIFIMKILDWGKLD